MATLRAPRHLSKSSRKLYSTLVEDYSLQDEPHALAVLKLACEALDRAEEARRILETEGPIYHDRFGAPKKHPAVSVEENARLAAARCFRELSLDGEPSDFRPPRAGSGALN